MVVREALEAGDGAALLGVRELALPGCVSFRVEGPELFEIDDDDRRDRAKLDDDFKDREEAFGGVHFEDLIRKLDMGGA